MNIQRIILLVAAVVVTLTCGFFVSEYVGAKRAAALAVKVRQVQEKWRVYGQMVCNGEGDAAAYAAHEANANTIGLDEWMVAFNACVARVDTERRADLAALGVR